MLTVGQTDSTRFNISEIQPPFVTAFRTTNTIEFHQKMSNLFFKKEAHEETTKEPAFRPKVGVANKPVWKVRIHYPLIR